MNRTLIVDPASYSLTFDIAFIKTYLGDSDTYLICSKTPYNQDLLEEEDIKYSLYNISMPTKIIGVLNYLFVLSIILLKSNKYDKIVFQWSIFPLFEIPFFFLMRKKLHFVIHNHIPHNDNRPQLATKILLLFVRNLIFLSKHTKKEFFNTYNVKKKVVTLEILLPIDNKDKTGNPPLYQNNNGNSTVIFLGNVKDYKGVDIFRDLSKIQDFKNYQFKIFGKWDKKLASLKKELSDNINIEIQDRFLTSEAFAAALSEDAVFVLPYKKITQSAIFYALLGNNRVFLASDVGDIRNFCKRHNLSELLFDRGSSKEFFTKLKYIQKNMVALSIKVSSAREEYIKKYSQIKLWPDCSESDPSIDTNNKSKSELI